MWDNNDTVIVNNLSGQFIGTTPVLCHKLKNKVRIKMNECESDTALNSLMHINVLLYQNRNTHNTRNNHHKNIIHNQPQ